MTTTPTPPNPPKRKGMIVEDAQAAVRTNPDGSQKVVKTNDRKGEADRQGKTESQV